MAISAGKAFAITVAALVKAILMISIGVTLTFFPKKKTVLNTTVASGISGLVYYVFGFSLGFNSFGKALDSNVLGELVPVIIAAFVMELVGCLIGYVVVRILKLPHTFQAPFVLGVAFQNGLSLPLTFLDTLCQSAVFVTEKQCNGRGTMFILTVSVAWNLVFFTLGRFLMMRKDPNAAESRPRASSTSNKPMTCKRAFKRFTSHPVVRPFANPLMLGIILGVIVGLSPALKTEFFGDALARAAGKSVDQGGGSGVLYPIGQLTETLRAPMVPSLLLVLGTTVGTYLKQIQESREAKKQRGGKSEETQEAEAELEAAAAAAEAAQTRELDDLNNEEGSDEDDEAAGVRASAEDSAAGVALVQLDVKTDDEAGAADGGEDGGKSACLDTSTHAGTVKAVNSAAVSAEDVTPPKRAVVMFVVARLILCPAVMFPMLYGARKAGWFPGDRVLQSVLYVQAMTPSASLTLVLLKQMQQHSQASAFAVMCMYQYGPSMATLTVWLVLSLALLH